MHNSFYQDMIRQKSKPSNSLMDFATFGYMWVKVNSQKLVASHTIYTILEKEPFSEFFTVQTWRNYVHPKDLYKLLQAEEELLQTGNPTLAEYRLITETGRHIYVHHQMYLSGVRSNESRIMSIVQDMTEQKRADIILEAMNEGFFELDEKFALRRINEQALKFWGLQHSDTIRKKIDTVIPQIVDSVFHKILLRAQDEKISIAQDIQDPVTGHWLHLSVAPYADGLIVTFYDIEAEKEAEKKNDENRQLLEAAKVEKIVLEAEHKFRMELQHEVEERVKELKEKTHLMGRIADVMPDLLSIIDLHTMKISFINKNVLFEMGFDDLEKLTSEERTGIIHPDDRLLLQKYFEDFATASDDDVIDVEYRAKIKTGEWHWFHAKGKVFSRDESGQPTHCVNIVQNINKRKNSERQIEDLNYDLLVKNKQLEGLIAELKTFNSLAVNYYAETLRHVYINLETIVTTDARNLSNSSRANIRRAQAAIQKMKLLTNDINLYLELYDAGNRIELIDPNIVLTGVKEKMQKKLEDSNAIITIASLPKIYADPLLFSKLMIHIIDNSIKHRKPDVDPVININYSLIAELNSVPDARPNTAYVNISVTDNGIGFREEENKIIFNLFTQLEAGKHKGSGIGLAICKKILDMHGGFIAAESKPGEGATFHCYFPPPLKAKLRGLTNLE